jgi:hypothetical protein
VCFGRSRLSTTDVLFVIDADMLFRVFGRVCVLIVKLGMC